MHVCNFTDPRSVNHGAIRYTLHPKKKFRPCHVNGLSMTIPTVHQIFYAISKSASELTIRFWFILTQSKWIGCRVETSSTNIDLKKVPIKIYHLRSWVQKVEKNPIAWAQVFIVEMHQRVNHSISQDAFYWYQYMAIHCKASKQVQKKNNFRRKRQLGFFSKGHILL